MREYLLYPQIFNAHLPVVILGLKNLQQTTAIFVQVRTLNTFIIIGTGYGSELLNSIKI